MASSFVRANRKAIYGAVAGFFGSLAAAVAKDGIDPVEMVGIAGATVLGYLAVWAAPANVSRAEQEARDGGG